MGALCCGAPDRDKCLGELEGIQTNPASGFGWKSFQVELQGGLARFVHGSFQYYLPDGMIKETTFQLEGIQQAIKEMVNADNR